MRNEMQATMSNQTNELKNMMANFFQMNTASSSGSLPSNTIASPKGDLKAITTQSGVSYDEPPIKPPLSSLPKEVEREPEVIKDTVLPSTKNIQPLVFQIQAPFDEPVVALKPKPSIPYPSRANKQKLREKDDILASKFVEIFRELHFKLGFAMSLPPSLLCQNLLQRRVEIAQPGRSYVHSINLSSIPFNDEAITFKVGQTLRYSYNNSESVNRIDVIGVSCEEYAQEVLSFSDSSKSGNPTPSLDPILSTSFPSLTPFEGGDFILEEIKACLTNDSIPPGIDDAP
ncbi:hypothetical protein Tco_1320966 [Tanacetum coccineum]